MNTRETAKKIKWITKRVEKEITKNRFSTKFASLYTESDEDIETWQEYIDGNDDFSNLILFIVIIECNYFQLEIQIREKDVYLGLFKMEEGGFDYETNPFEMKKENDEPVRKLLEHVSTSLGSCFSELHRNSKEKAYEGLFKSLQQINAE